MAASTGSPAKAKPGRATTATPVGCPASITRSASARRSKPGCWRSTKLWKRVSPTFAKRRARWRCSTAPALRSRRNSAWSGSFRLLPTPRSNSPGLSSALSFTMSSTKTARPTRCTRFQARRAKLLRTSRCRATRPYSTRPSSEKARSARTTSSLILATGRTRLIMACLPDTCPCAAIWRYPWSPAPAR